MPLHQGDNDVQVTVRSARGESQPFIVRVRHNGEGALDKRGTLWLLAVGVDKYPGAKVSYDDLSYAGQAAWEFAAERRGAFTYVLAKGLAGAPKAIDPVLQAVTVYRLGPYVRSEVTRRTQGARTPEFFPGAGDFVLARR